MLAADPTTSLQEWLEKHSQALGSTVLKRFGLKLPFLFKVSLQVLPTHSVTAVTILWPELATCSSGLTLLTSGVTECRFCLWKQPYLSSPILIRSSLRSCMHSDQRYS